MSAACTRIGSAAVEVDLYRFDLDRAASRVDALARWLSDEELARAARFVSTHDRRYWTICRGLLRTTLAAYMDRPANALPFAIGASGKPRVVSEADGEPLHFNLSHSGDVALLAVSRFGPLGIDVEAIRPMADWAAVARRCFSPVEREQLQDVPSRERQRAFYRCWTRKEAVIKATGEGLSADLQAFEVTLDAREPARMLSYRASAHSDWALAHIEPRQGYVGALAVAGAALDGISITHRQTMPAPHLAADTEAACSATRHPGPTTIRTTTNAFRYAGFESR